MILLSCLMTSKLPSRPSGGLRTSRSDDLTAEIATRLPRTGARLAGRSPPAWATPCETSTSVPHRRRGRHKPTLVGPPQRHPCSSPETLRLRKHFGAFTTQHHQIPNPFPQTLRFCCRRDLLCGGKWAAGKRARNAAELRGKPSPPPSPAPRRSAATQTRTGNSPPPSKSAGLRTPLFGKTIAGQARGEDSFASPSPRYQEKMSYKVTLVRVLYPQIYNRLRQCSEG